MAELQKLRYTHEAIADALCANPMAPQGEIARLFGYSDAWLSTIIHSDAFQVYYRKLAEERGVAAVHTFMDKLQGLGALAIDRTAALIAQGQASERLLTDTTELTLKALGYLNGGSGPANGQAQQQPTLHIHVDADMLTAARENAAKRFVDGDPSRVNGRQALDCAMNDASATVDAVPNHDLREE